MHTLTSFIVEVPEGCSLPSTIILSGCWRLQFMTYAAYRSQLESAFLADELSSAAAARQDLKAKRLSMAQSDAMPQDSQSGLSQPGDLRTDRSSAQVSPP